MRWHYKLHVHCLQQVLAKPGMPYTKTHLLVGVVEHAGEGTLAVSIKSHTTGAENYCMDYWL